MALKDTWVDKKDGVDINSADDINEVAHAVIELEENGVGGTGITAKVETVEGGAKVTVTDENGTTTATVTNGKDGEPGDPGVSPTVSVTSITGGHRITITDKSGTKTVDVMDGAKGDTGATGAQGPKGDTGAQGPKGDKGDPYTLSEADKDAITASVIESLGGNPVFGYVDANNNIIVSGNLADGSYSVKYEMENGSTVNIGSLVLSGSEPEPTYTNLADPTSADWVVGKRFNSSGALVDVDSGVNGATTNYIGGDLVAGDIIRVKNMDLTTYRVAVYDSAKTLKITTPLNNSALASTVENVTVNTTEASFTVKAGSHLTSGGYIRFCGPLTGTSEDVIITKNEEIV